MVKLVKISNVQANVASSDQSGALSALLFTFAQNGCSVLNPLRRRFFRKWKQLLLPVNFSTWANFDENTSVLIECEPLRWELGHETQLLLDSSLLVVKKSTW